MKETTTAIFFHWMAENNISRQEAAQRLGVDERSLSNYRSRGLPKKKEARALRIIEEHRQANAPSIEHLDHITKLSITFSDEDFSLVERAAHIVGSTTREFIQKAATFKAKEEIAANAKLSIVAEDHKPYRMPSPKKD